MSLEKLMSMMSRLFFLGAFVLLGLAVIERVANECGYTILRHRGSRLLEFAVVLLVFVVVIQLRELREELKSRKP